MTEQQPVSPASGPQLLRALGPLQGTMIVVGTVIGSGIFLKPAKIATQVPYFNGIMLVWIVSGLLSLAGALAYAELGAMMPRAGGQYVYLREAYGPFVGFLFGWTEFLVNRTGSIAALAVGSATYFSELHPLDDTGKAAYALIAIALLTTINYLGVKFGGLVQMIFTIAKVSALAGIVVGALFLGHGTTANFQPMMPDHFDRGMLGLFGAAMIGALWAYDGWTNGTTIAEELRDPQRNVPRCLLQGTLIVMGIYLSVNLAYHYALPMNVVQHAQRAVGAQAAFTMIGPLGVTLVSLGVMCSTFGAANGTTLTGARIFFDMGRQRSFFAAFGAVHPRFRTPHMSVTVQGMWACALILLANVIRTKKPIFDVLTESVIVASWVFYALAVGAVFVLRYKRPDLERPYRCWGYPVVPALFVVMAVWFVGNAFCESPQESMVGFVITALGAPAYLFFKRAAPPPGLYAPAVVEEMEVPPE